MVKSVFDERAFAFGFRKNAEEWGKTKEKLNVRSGRWVYEIATTSFGVAITGKPHTHRRPGATLFPCQRWAVADEPLARFRPAARFRAQTSAGNANHKINVPA